ncbi:MAG: FtsW/RodA/SpoVE family cell cycle protein [Ruminococcus sp.]|nr:FtsW/RodA/SpoVE family cell cycle protein [Ruminococcus sp.]
MAPKMIKRMRDGGLVYERKGFSVKKHTEIELGSSRDIATERNVFSIKPVFSKVDRPFLILVLVLLGFGLIMMFSASYAWGLEEGDGYFYIKKQALFAAIGLGVMWFASIVDYHNYLNTKIAFGFFFLMCGLTLYTAIAGTATADASRWIVIGSFRFQPSELLKISLIIVFAYTGAVNFPKYASWKYSTIPYAAYLGIAAGLLALQRHISAVMLISILGLSLMFVSGVPLKTFVKFIVILVALASVAALVLYFAKGSFAYIEDRFTAWKDPMSDIQGKTHQTYNALLAIGSGGIFGLGFGESRQKYLYLSESQNDFVFAIVCEEFGLIGAIVVILLFSLLIVHGFYIASRAKDRFGMLLAAGITIQIGSQALLNMMVACNAFPNTGISLPFFSYGGTALIITLGEIGILLNVSRQARVKKRK